MPFVPFPVALPNGAMAGLWKIEEPESFFRAALRLLPEEETHLSAYRDEGKRLEWLASRLIIRTLLNPTDALLSVTMEDGRPEIRGWAGKVSISHTFGWAAAILNRDALPGIDVEWKNREIQEALRNRFLHPEEKKILEQTAASNADEQVVLTWSAKETLFKLTGRNGVSFRQDLFVNLPETFRGNAGSLPACIRNHGTEQEIELHYYSLEDIWVTWAFLDLPAHRL